MKLTTFALATVTFAASAALAISQFAPKQLCDGFLPPNDMKIPVGAKIRSNFITTGGGGITEAQFNKVMDRIERLYKPVVAQEGGVLQIKRLWTDPQVNAAATRKGSTWVLEMYGGLARHQATNEEGMALVACHELGHHLGGAPKNKGWFGMVDWSTDEGGADYFATLKCLRNYFAEDDNETILAARPADPFAVARCNSQFTQHADQLLCQRAALGATSTSLMFMDMGHEPVAASFATPDPTIATFLPEDNPDPNADVHSATQCRMDTFFNGATCTVDKSVANSKTDYRQGACVQGVDQYGWRPRCWFVP